MDFRYSETIFFRIYSNFTFDPETYDIAKLYHCMTDKWGLRQELAQAFSAMLFIL